MRGILTRLMVLLVLVASASPAVAAPIDIVLRLDPDQNRPLNSWSLTLDVEAGYEVGAINLLVRGLDSFSINTANAGISVLDSVFVLDPLGDGRNVLILNNPANGIAIAAGPFTGALLGTFTSSSLQGVALFDCEFECGGTVFDTFLVALPASDFSFRIETNLPVGAIPEPAYLGYVSMLIAAVTIATVSRRSALVTPKALSPSAARTRSTMQVTARPPRTR